MRGKGFEPLQALSHWGLDPIRLTTPASPLNLERKKMFKRFVNKVVNDKSIINKSKRMVVNDKNIESLLINCLYKNFFDLGV